MRKFGPDRSTPHSRVMPTQWKSLPLAPVTVDDDTIIVRQSTIGQLQLCGKRVEYKDQEGFLEPVSEALCFGSCLHYLIGEDLTRNEIPLDLLANMEEWVERLLVTDYDWTLARVPNYPEFLENLRVGYRSWREVVRPLLGVPVAIEELMYVPLGEYKGRNIVLQGTPDFVEGEWLNDWKTSGRNWAQAKADASIQASLYPSLVKQTHGVSIRKFRFYVYNTAKRTWTRLETSRSVQQVNGAMATAYDWGKVLAERTFVAQPVPEASFDKKRGWYCKAEWCGAFNICAFKYVGNPDIEGKVAIRSW